MRFLIGFILSLLIAIPAVADWATLSATSMAASFNGSAYTVMKPYVMTAQMTVSSCSSCDGIAKLQASNAVSPGSTDWVDIDSASVHFVADGTSMIQIPYPGFLKLRVVYTRTAGSGTLTTTLSTKEMK
jgi:hypothetical protein